MSGQNGLEPPAQTYLEKLNNSSQTFLSVLDDYKKYYVFYNKNPEVDEFQQYFANSKSQLQSINKDVFETTKSIEQSIEKLNDQLIRLNTQLGSEKDLKRELSGLAGGLTSTTNGAKTMNEDATAEYTDLYYVNVELFMGSFVLIGLMVMLNKHKQ